ncbi:tyrosine-type recombinase/integrase [Brevibacillus porteri]|uniref:Integrase n=1 Tax=Brevibacillus porteri TaxID=2126350 RepID=A0ABX5FIH6_9BACL|nr:tyrosine-type recombinase/integrase [Brevibacillus porteri]MED1802929.1 tyrosine-type recombinase/integrase [Brevibacillus porteri]MED2135105.1 tyrosine-type recombinase/integrase [Brevibacillus porteri]MED2746347.1 tyrosine-type recombinase/integrase [Brevibacillus porteri]MED2817931.1 tyrosine-type recombinase/integrase [Brevibacillus porteri]MED2895563.1 tyrosine-type recombinase/integrase [Brevibacillus porteri]
MVLKKRAKRTPIGRRQADTGYPRLTFDQAFDLVVSAKCAEGVRERTLTGYSNHWKQFTKWLRDNYDVEYVDELTSDHFRDHVNYMRYDAKRYDGHKFITSEQRIGLSDTTVNIRLRTLKAVFNHLSREELIEVNPITNVKLIRQDVDLTNCFTDDEVKALLEQPDRRDFVGFRDFVGMTCLLDSGMRASELLGLRIPDIDFQTRFITIPGERSKNRKPRHIPISAHTSKLLLQLISENREHFTTDRLFLSCYGEPLSPNHFNKRLKYYGERAGISAKKMTSHVWRHTWAKGMVLNGADPFTIQKMGGWADIRTMRRYVQMDTEDIRNSHDAYSPVNRFIRKR